MSRQSAYLAASHAEMRFQIIIDRSERVQFSLIHVLTVVVPQIAVQAVHVVRNLD